MEILKEIKPAEAYFLMNWLATDNHLLNYTLGSLLMEKQLEVLQILKYRHPNAKRRTSFKMIRRGEKFNISKARTYEKEILSVMGKDENKEIQLRLFTKAVGSSFSNYNQTFRDDYLGRCDELNEYFQDHFILKYFDRRTYKGKKLGKKLKIYFESKDEELKKYQENGNIKESLKLIASLGVHIILLKNFSTDIILELKKKSSSHDNSYFNDFVYLDGNFSNFSETFDSFNGFGGGDFGGSGAGGDWGDSVSSFSSCSGCSGCSGCGGCS